MTDSTPTSQHPSSGPVHSDGGTWVYLDAEIIDFFKRGYAIPGEFPDILDAVAAAIAEGREPVSHRTEHTHHFGESCNPTCRHYDVVPAVNNYADCDSEHIARAISTPTVARSHYPANRNYVYRDDGRQ